MDISTFQDRIEQIVHMIRLLKFAVREDEIDPATGNLDYDPCKGWAKIKQALGRKPRPSCLGVLDKL
jgi:hypothetical protein